MTYEQTLILKYLSAGINRNGLLLRKLLSIQEELLFPKASDILSKEIPLKSKKTSHVVTIETNIPSLVLGRTYLEMAEAHQTSAYEVKTILENIMDLVRQKSEE